MFTNVTSKNIPEIPISEDVHFFHFAHNAPNESTELKIGEKLNENINRTLPWKFFVHGWTTNPAVSPWFHTGKAAYFSRGNYNVVFVDWSRPANQSYLESVIHAVGSGKYFGKFIVHLNDNGVPLDSIHILGHSLGAHMSGFAGKYVFDVKGTNIDRITGLDPAGPFYERNPLLKISVHLLPSSARLSKEDAKFVDIIHTDSNQYGIFANIGHIDFYPNGGSRKQPGCENTIDENCSHAKSTQFYVESINSNNFVARECISYENYEKGFCKNNTRATMGEDTDHALRGIFYLSTNPESPYAKGETI